MSCSAHLISSGKAVENMCWPQGPKSGFGSGQRRNSGEGNGNLLQYSCLENPMDRGAWKAAVHGVAKSRARLSNFTFTFHFHALEKEMATHSSVLAWSISEMAEPSGLLSWGRTESDTTDLTEQQQQWRKNTEQRNSY